MTPVFWPIWDSVRSLSFLPVDSSQQLRFLENETEVSFFNRQAYDQFKLNPQVSSPFSGFHAYQIQIHVLQTSWD